MSGIRIDILTSIFFSAVFSFATADLALALNRSMIRNMSFEENIKRYPSPLAVLETMKSVAPFRAPSAEPCLEIGLASAPVLGAIDPAQLQPLETQPGALFYNYFEKCTIKIAALGFLDEQNSLKNSELILGRDLTNALLKVSGSQDVKNMWNTKVFSSLPMDMQNQLADRAITFLLGPEELLRYFRYIGDGNVFGRPLAATTDLRALIIEKLGGNVSLLTFYSRTAVLLRLGPVLKD